MRWNLCRTLPCGISSVRNLILAAVLALLPVSGSADVTFTPVTVAPHVYDGGWEHFVGGGLTVFDCDDDGRLDMLAAGGTAEMSLYRNTSSGDVAFTHSTTGITGATGAYALDLDGDDVLDLVIMRVGPDILLRGQGDCQFEPMTLPGLNLGDHWTTAFSATWEAEGSPPTLAFGHYVNRADPDGPFEACDENHLWRPDAHGSYAKTALTPGYCPLSALFTDWQRNGQAELRLSNDRHYYVRDGQEQMWRMTHPPRQLTEADGWQRHQLWGMGIATRDLDRDGRDEVFLSSMGDQRLMRQETDTATFRDVPFAMGTTAHRPYTGDDGRPSTGWHIAFGDVQNDGRDDAFIAKGNVQEMPGLAMKDPNNLLIQQPDGSFAEAGDAAGIVSFHRGRGAALADFNGDGLLDLAVVNRRAPLEVWQNTTPVAGNWLRLDLRAAGSNRRGVGAWVELRDATGVQSREVQVGGGHAGGVAGPMHFGLGEAQVVDVRVKWPGRGWSDWEEVVANQTLRLTRYADGFEVSAPE